MDNANSTNRADVPASAPPEREGWTDWLRDNVAKPFVSGTGVLQIASNFTTEPLSWHAPTARTNVDWVVQTASSAAGGLLAYVPMGKATSGALTAFGRGADRALIATGSAEGLSLGTARLLSHSATGNILGAGIYDFAKRPGEGESRTGNAVGSMAGFAMFEGGNRALHFAGASRIGQQAHSALVGELGGTMTRTLSAGSMGVGRFAVGAVGGATTFETARFLNQKITGQEQGDHWEGLKESMMSGGFINFGFPVAHRAATRVYDATVNAPEWGRGVPIGRQINYLGYHDPEVIALAHEMPLTRVKVATDGMTRADVRANVVYVGANEGPGVLAHELRHIQLARLNEPEYRRIGEMLRSESPAVHEQAEQQYYQLRSQIESDARKTEDRVNSRTAVPAAGTSNGATRTAALADNVALIHQRARNGRTYGEIWHDEWTRFKEDPSYRPRVEFEGETPERAATHDAKVWGSPEKFGANVENGGTNFAVYGPDATRLDLWLFDKHTDSKPSQILPMFRTGDVWHRFVPEVGHGQFYLFNADGPYDPANGKRVNKNVGLLDPYSRAISDDTAFPIEGTDQSHQAKSIVVDHSKFDWGDDRRPNIPLDDTVMLEVNIRGITAAHPDVPPELRGTYEGLAQIMPWLKNLGEEGRKGPTTLQLMPTMEFDFDDFGRVNPVTGEKLLNSWGYNTVGFMAPEGQYSAAGRLGQQVDAFKNLVKTAHQNGMEHVMDIVINHTREGDANGPTRHFRGLANEHMYMLEPNDKSKYVNHSGTGNTTNANHPAMRRFIIDTLRHWADEYHVDGFRFDLASTFKYDVDGAHKFKTDIIRDIENDPVLSKLKLIAEPWTASGAYDRGHFSDRVWMEQDGKFRDVVRKYVKGDEGQLADLVELIKGSPAEFDREQGRRPNTFVVYHDGLTGRDLVEFNEKHNYENGENNNDGDNSNNSWNTGHEGPVKGSDLPLERQQEIENMRMQLMKNKMALLLMSQGVPIIYYLDLFAQSNDGNNNVWAQPRRNVLNWDRRFDPVGKEYFDFIRYLIDLRRQYNIGGQGPGMPFHGTEPYQPDLGANKHFIGFSYPNLPTGQTLSVYSNAYWGNGVNARLPAQSHLVFDTQHRTFLPPDPPWSVDAQNRIVFPTQPLDSPLFSEYTIGPRSIAVFRTPLPDAKVDLENKPKP